MTTKNISLIGAPLTNNFEWKSTNWISAQKLVFRLQMRIAKAMKEKKYNKVKILQRLLTRSYLQYFGQFYGEITPQLLNAL